MDHRDSAGLEARGPVAPAVTCSGGPTREDWLTGRRRVVMRGSEWAVEEARICGTGRGCELSYRWELVATFAVREWAEWAARTRHGFDVLRSLPTAGGGWPALR